MENVKAACHARGEKYNKKEEDLEAEADEAN